METYNITDLFFFRFFLVLILIFPVYVIYDKYEHRTEEEIKFKEILFELIFQYSSSKEMVEKKRSSKQFRFTLGLKFYKKIAKENLNFY